MVYHIYKKSLVKKQISLSNDEQWYLKQLLVVHLARWMVSEKIIEQLMFIDLVNQ